MQKEIQQILEASEGLLFMSESDYPFEPVELQSGTVEQELKTLAGKPQDTPIETQSIEYFFRNMVKTYPGDLEEQQATAQRFLKLQELLKQKLQNAQVYRIGSIQVDAFLIGKLPGGSFGGLRTKLIET